MFRTSSRFRGSLTASALGLIATCGPSVLLADAPIAYTADRLAASTRDSTPQAAIARVLRDLRGVTQADVVRGGPGVRSDLSLVVSTPTTGDGGDLRAVWRASLLVGAVGDLVGAGATAKDNASASVAEALPDGSRVPGIELVGGEVTPRQAFTDEPPDVVRARAARVATECGLSVVSVAVERGITAAPDVVFRSPSESRVSTCPDLLARLFGPIGQQRYEGYYLEVDAPSGRAMIRTSASFRLGTGGSSGDFVGQIGIVHGTPPGTVLPPTIGFAGLHLGGSARSRPAVYQIRLFLPSGSHGTVVIRRAGVVLARGSVSRTRGGWQRFSLPALRAPLRHGRFMLVKVDIRGIASGKRKFGHTIDVQVPLRRG